MLLTVCYHNWSVSWYRFAAVNMMIRTMAIPSSKQQVVSRVISWNNFLYYDNEVWEYHWLFVIDPVSWPDVVLRHVSHTIIKFHCVVSSILNGIHCPRTTLESTWVINWRWNVEETFWKSQKYTNKQSIGVNSGICSFFPSIFFFVCVCVCVLGGGGGGGWCAVVQWTMNRRSPPPPPWIEIPA